MGRKAAPFRAGRESVNSLFHLFYTKKEAIFTNSKPKSVSFYGYFLR